MTQEDPPLSSPTPSPIPSPPRGNVASDNDVAAQNQLVQSSLRNKKKSRHFLRPLQRKQDSSAGYGGEPTGDLIAQPQQSSLDFHEITVNGSAQEIYTEHSDIFKWATLYENQRGITMFSSPYYSSASLLPNDPPPFTLPHSDDGHEIPPVSSLEAYPLPSPMWMWVSKYWMVDMRGDEHIDPEGWEFNWSFRKKGWRSCVGPLSAGGWVRRRRWVRLMMCPARLEMSHSSGSLTQSGSQQSQASGKEQEPRTGEDEEEVWQGRPDDWERCRKQMRKLIWDGRRLETWKRWVSTTDHANASWQSIARVLEEHGRDLLSAFVYPSSRMKFLQILRAAGLEMDINLSTDVETEFWSMANEVT
ncbi:hypothetical protein SISNIDRAFT_485905 [Sistotremastrum niveocremeum HHB9708]|uniref:TECPR1-like DysF domain-containing protein n=1 Tax=Sistotremastrum niveocremeum HHB9708 TaxID=1314777 RepID=A0A164U6D8_9AGAM|nr:hypothetical protein SISNIDRAFT_485905 [Sistotremastrum niveocremeum HHB9708]